MDAVAFLDVDSRFFSKNYHQNLQASALFSGGVLAAGRNRIRRDLSATDCCAKRVASAIGGAE